MFDRMKQKLFPSEQSLEALRAIHAQSVQLNIAAQERLIKACEKKETCPLVDRRVDPNRHIFRCIG